MPQPRTHHLARAPVDGLEHAAIRAIAQLLRDLVPVHGDALRSLRTDASPTPANASGHGAHTQRSNRHRCERNVGFFLEFINNFTTVLTQTRATRALDASTAARCGQRLRDNNTPAASMIRTKRRVRDARYEPYPDRAPARPHLQRRPRSPDGRSTAEHERARGDDRRCPRPYGSSGGRNDRQRRRSRSPRRGHGGRRGASGGGSRSKTGGMFQRDVPVDKSSLDIARAFAPWPSSCEHLCRMVLPRFVLPRFACTRVRACLRVCACVRRAGGMRWRPQVREKQAGRRTQGGWPSGRSR